MRIPLMTSVSMSLALVSVGVVQAQERSIEVGVDAMSARAIGGTGSSSFKAPHANLRGGVHITDRVSIELIVGLLRVADGDGCSETSGPTDLVVECVDTSRGAYGFQPMMTVQRQFPEGRIARAYLAAGPVILRRSETRRVETSTYNLSGFLIDYSRTDPVTSAGTQIGALLALGYKVPAPAGFVRLELAVGHLLRTGQFEKKTVVAFSLGLSNVLT